MLQDLVSKPRFGTAALHLGGSHQRDTVPQIQSPLLHQSQMHGTKLRRKCRKTQAGQNWAQFSTKTELHFLNARTLERRTPSRWEHLLSPSLLYIINALGHGPYLQPHIYTVTSRAKPWPKPDTAVIRDITETLNSIEILKREMLKGEHIIFSKTSFRLHCGSYKGEWADAAATAFPNFQKHCLLPFKQMIMQQRCFKHCKA